MRAIVLYSGGPDSFLTYVKAVEEHGPRETFPVYFDLGHRYAEMELAAVKRTIPRTVVVDVLRGLGQWEERDANIHARNAHLILAASRIAGGGPVKILLSVQKDETSLPDRSPAFFQQMQKVLNVLAPGSEVDSPWFDLYKTSMVEWLVTNHPKKVEDLKETRSCYQPRGSLQCGDCPACFRRWVAFSLNGIDERYATDPRTSKTAKEYADRAAKRQYSDARNHRILSALGEKPWNE